MEKNKTQFETELLTLPALRFMLSGLPTNGQKELLRLNPVQKSGKEMEINVRKLIAHLNGTK